MNSLAKFPSSLLRRKSTALTLPSRTNSSCIIIHLNCGTPPWTVPAGLLTGGVVRTTAVRMSVTLRTAPPPPPIRKGHVQVFEATSNYKAQRDCELSFEEGDLLFVLDRNDPKWWLASSNRKKGYIPSDLVSNDNVKMLIVDAARRGNYELLDECLEAGVSVNALDKSGCSALHGAAQAGHMDCVMRLLKEPKLEINLQNKIGDTPLHCAAVRGHCEVLKVLLKHGANPDLTNREDQTPRTLAKRGTIITLLDQGLEYEETGRQGDDIEDSEDSD